MTLLFVVKASKDIIAAFSNSYHLSTMIKIVDVNKYFLMENDKSFKDCERNFSLVRGRMKHFKK